MCVLDMDHHCPFVSLMAFALVSNMVTILVYQYLNLCAYLLVKSVRLMTLLVLVFTDWELCWCG